LRVVSPDYGVLGRCAYTYSRFGESASDKLNIDPRIALDRRLEDELLVSVLARHEGRPPIEHT
jgi:hypothetical protein